MSIANRYRRDGLNGIGFLCERSGVMVHAVAWENGDVDRYRDGSDNMLFIDVMDMDGNSRKPVEMVKEAESAPSETMTEPVADVDAIKWAPVPGDTEAASIRSYITSYGMDVENKQVIDALAEHGIAVNSSQVSAAKKSLQKS